MEIYLLRHGQSVANEKMLVCGDADYPLSALGKLQAERICRVLSAFDFTRVYSSTLSRAMDTVKGLECKSPVVAERMLRELGTGDVSHITLSELWASDERYRQPWLVPDLRYPGGETFNEMFGRVTDWLARNMATWSEDEKVLIVGHEGTLRSMYLHLFGKGLADFPEFGIGNCDYLRFTVTPGRQVVMQHVPLGSADGGAG